MTASIDCYIFPNMIFILILNLSHHLSSIQRLICTENFAVYKDPDLEQVSPGLWPIFYDQEFDK